MAKQHSVFKRKLNLGMIGGGPGAFIGDVHRKAARLDGGIDYEFSSETIIPALGHLVVVPFDPTQN